MNVVLIGAPASGKGSQAKLIEENWHIVHISTGDMFRTIMNEKNELGLIVKQFMDRAMLVPDKIVLQVVKERLKMADCENGVLFDGFPRTILQAKELDKIVKIDAVIFLNVKLEELLKRAENRLVCPNCKKIFIKNDYKSEFCDRCGTKLVKRKDDDKEIVKKRYEEFKTLTMPLVDYYKTTNKLFEIVGEGGISDVYKKVNEVLKSVKE